MGYRLPEGYTCQFRNRRYRPTRIGYFDYLIKEVNDFKYLRFRIRSLKKTKPNRINRVWMSQTKVRISKTQQRSYAYMVIPAALAAWGSHTLENTRNRHLYDDIRLASFCLSSVARQSVNVSWPGDQTDLRRRSTTDSGTVVGGSNETIDSFSVTFFAPNLCQNSTYSYVAVIQFQLCV